MLRALGGFPERRAAFAASYGVRKTTFGVHCLLESFVPMDALRPRMK